MRERRPRTVNVLLVLSSLAWAGHVGAGDRPTPVASHTLSAAVKPDGTVLDVVGLTKEQIAAIAAARFSDRQWGGVIRVDVGSDKPAAGLPSVAGTIVIEETVVRFRPRYPLVAGTPYRVRFDTAKCSEMVPRLRDLPPALDVTVRLPPLNNNPAEVRAVYPSADALPENLLRWYFHFSRPMSRGGVYRYIHLLTADGTEVELPFLELDEELWNKDGTRFTLLIDPGRIKRGLKPREDVGPALEAGKRYTLVIDREWPDATGKPLAESYRKAFRVTAPVETAVEPKTWDVIAPAGGSTDALVIRFHRPVDRGLADRLVELQDGNGRAVEGVARLRTGEAVWEFTPTKSWRNGPYRLAVDTRFEDVCGNRVGRPFEVDLFHPVENEIKLETVYIPVTAR